jgi:alpha-L-fucosidase 2
MPSFPWIWNSLPSGWHEGAFLGNGLLGFMVWREGEALRFEIGRSDVYNRQEGLGPGAQGRLPIGDFFLRVPGLSAGEFRLDLDKACLEARLSGADGEVRLRARVQYDEEICLLEWEGPLPPEALHWVAAESIVSTDRSRNTPNPPPRFDRQGAAHVHVQPLLGGGEFGVGWRAESQGSGRGRILFTIANTWPESCAREQCLESLHRFASRSPAEAWDSHVAEWADFHARSQVVLPDPELQTFYERQVYKLGSAVRPDGPLLDLFGPWYHPARWTQIFWNLNVQLAYSPVYASGHADLGLSLARWLRDNLPQLEGNVPEAWREPGRAALHAPTGIDGRGAENHELGNLIWACHSLWLHYRHTLDPRILEDALYPVLRAAVAAVMARLELDAAWVLHVPEARSPEYDGLSRDTNYDIALLRWGCGVLLDTCALLDVRDPASDAWQDVLDNLSPPQTDRQGLRIGRDLPFAESHRHWSHLIGFYPLYLYHTNDPSLRRLLDTSLGHWLSLDRHLAGYSFAGAASMYAMLGQPADALRCLKRLINDWLCPNTMYLEPCHPFDRLQPDPAMPHPKSPTIETPLAGMRAILDLLVGVWDDTLFLLPGVPPEWHDLSFAGLSAEGGLSIDLVLAKGSVADLSIRSLGGGTCRVHCARAAFAHARISGARLLSVSPGSVLLSIPSGGQARLTWPGGGDT